MKNSMIMNLMKVLISNIFGSKLIDKMIKEDIINMK